MSTRLTIRVTDDVIEAINVILSAEPGGTSQTYAISKAVTEYAKVVAKRLVSEQEAPKVATPVSPEERLRKWTQKAEVKPAPYYVSADPDDDSDPIDYDPT